MDKYTKPGLFEALPSAKQRLLGLGSGFLRELGEAGLIRLVTRDPAKPAPGGRTGSCSKFNRVHRAGGSGRKCCPHGPTPGLLRAPSPPRRFTGGSKI